MFEKRNNENFVNIDEKKETDKRNNESVNNDVRNDEKNCNDDENKENDERNNEKINEDEKNCNNDENKENDENAIKIDKNDEKNDENVINDEKEIKRYEKEEKNKDEKNTLKCMMDRARNLKESLKKPPKRNKKIEMKRKPKNHNINPKETPKKKPELQLMFEKMQQKKEMKEKESSFVEKKEKRIENDRRTPERNLIQKLPEKQLKFTISNQLSGKGKGCISRGKVRLLRANFSPHVQKSLRNERPVCSIIDSPGKRKIEEVDSQETANSVQKLVGFFGSGNRTKRVKN